MALKKTQNDFRHQTSEAYLRRGGRQKNLRNIWFQEEKIHTLGLPGLKIETEWRVMLGGLCAAEAAQGWVLESNIGYLHDFRKSLFFAKPPFLLRSGGCTTQLYLKAYLAQTVFLGAFSRVHFWVSTGKCTTLKNQSSPEPPLKKVSLNDL